MRWFRSFRSLFGAKPRDPVFESLERGVCPDCLANDFMAGPMGGAALNIECYGCGSCFNIAPANNFGGGINVHRPLLLAERIGWNNSGRWVEKGRLRETA
jgi:hypothetical protein